MSYINSPDRFSMTNLDHMLVLNFKASFTYVQQVFTLQTLYLLSQNYSSYFIFIISGHIIREIRYWWTFHTHNCSLNVVSFKLLIRKITLLPNDLHNKLHFDIKWAIDSVFSKIEGQNLPTPRGLYPTSEYKTSIFINRT